MSVAILAVIVVFVLLALVFLVVAPLLTRAGKKKRGPGESVEVPGKRRRKRR